MRTHRIGSIPTTVWVAGIWLAAGALQPAALLAAGNARVTGGGQYFGAFGHTVVSVNAVQHPNGTVTGQFQQYHPDPSKQIVHGRVTCLDFVTEKTVAVSGVITHVKNPLFPDILPGAPFAVLIHDGGEGAGAVDTVTPFLYDDVGVSLCGDPKVFAILSPYAVPLATGNFQVSR